MKQQTEEIARLKKQNKHLLQQQKCKKRGEGKGRVPNFEGHLVSRIRVLEINLKNLDFPFKSARSSVLATAKEAIKPFKSIHEGKSWEQSESPKKKTIPWQGLRESRPQKSVFADFWRE